MADAPKQIDEAVMLLRERYVQRDDAWAEQLAAGAYVKRCEPLTDQVLADHVRGRRVVGVYQLDKQSQVKWLLLDLDLRSEDTRVEDLKQEFIETLKQVQEAAAAIQLRGVCEFSGRRGYHLVFFLDQPLPAETARSMGSHIANQVTATGPISIEVFPKQSRLNSAKALGNLVKLPWGRHRLGGRSMFVDQNLDPIEPWFCGQCEFLQNAPVNNAEALAKVAESLDPLPDAMQEDALPVAPQMEHSDRSLGNLLLLLQSNPPIRDLFRGEPFAVDRYESRSEAEFALVMRLIRSGVSIGQINQILYAAGIGKWRHATDHYRTRTLKKAEELCRRGPAQRQAFRQEQSHAHQD